MMLIEPFGFIDAADMLPFLIFAEKIVITNQCSINFVAFLFVIQCAVYRINFPAICTDDKKSKYYEAVWNIIIAVSVNRKPSPYFIFFYLIANLKNSIDSKLFHLGEVLLWGMIYYIVCVSGSDIDR